MSHFNHKRHSDFGRFLVCCLQLFYTNYQLDRHSVAICLGSNRIKPRLIGVHYKVVLEDTGNAHGTGMRRSFVLN